MNEIEHTYEVGDRVKVNIPIEGHDHDHFYAATIITYWPHYSKKQGKEICMYRISIDGRGDTYVAVEQEDGTLAMVSEVRINEV